MQSFQYRQPFPLESGGALPELTISYTTYGHLNETGSNVIWICHALTANSEVTEWWPGMIGSGLAFDPDHYFIVCANILGSCYGTTGPCSRNPETDKPYFSSFPFFTIRDMVQAHRLLREHLQVRTIEFLVGGSMGGYQALEWCVLEPGVIRQLILLATSAAESAWGIAVHTAQRLAIEADCSWGAESADAGSKGLKAARAIGMLTYRNYDILVQKQTDPNPDKLEKHKAESYIRYQGDKLVSRFQAYSYWMLTKALDSHHIARGRNRSTEDMLRSIRQRTLVIGITSDILCPLQEQEFMARHLPDATLIVMDSAYGHDGFLVETGSITAHLQPWMARS